MVDIQEEEDPNTMMIAPVTKSKSSMCQMRYHVTDATKFLASVKKMTQCGNRVVFDGHQSFIQSKRTGQEMEMISENGVYKLDVIFMSGGRAER